MFRLCIYILARNSVIFGITRLDFDFYLSNLWFLFEPKYMQYTTVYCTTIDIRWYIIYVRERERDDNDNGSSFGILIK